MKRVFSVFLSACLVLGLASGCAGSGGKEGPKGDAPMGRYIEEQGEKLDGLTNVFNMRRTADGALTFYGARIVDGDPEYVRYTMDKDGKMTAEPLEWLKSLAFSSVRDIAQGADGTEWALYTDQTMAYKLAKSADGKTATEVVVPDLAAPQGGGMILSPGAEGSFTFGSSGAAEEKEDAAASDAEGSDAAVDSEAAGGIFVAPSGGTAYVEGGNSGRQYPGGVYPLADGEFLIRYGMGGVCKYSADGALLTEYPVGNAIEGGTVVSDNTLLLADIEQGEIGSYDLSTGKRSGTYTYDNLSFNSMLGMDSDGIYLADSSGIYRQAQGGSVWEKLVDGDLTTLVMPNVSILGLTSDGTGGFWAVVGAEESFQLMHYIYSAETPTNPDTELSIFALKNSATVRQAIGEFQRRNPNVRVNFRVGMEDESTATAEDVIRALNTEILAGKGPDLLVLDGLNVESYIEKGVLADITDVVNGVEGLLPNLMKAFERDGKVYGVPTRFTFPVMMGKADDVDAVKSLQDLAAKVNAGQSGTPPFLRPSDRLWVEEDDVGMMMDYYEACLNTWMGADGTIDQTALEAFFTNMLSIRNVLQENTPELGGSMAAITITVSTSGGFEPLDMGPRALAEGENLFHVGKMEGKFGLQNTATSLDKVTGGKMDTLFGGGVWYPGSSVGVVASSKQQELARSFVELMLSTTVQDSYTYDGYSVNGISLDKMVKELMSEEQSQDDKGFRSLCDRLSTPVLNDQVIKDAVSLQMKGLLDGSATPAQAAANVVEKTKLYLAE